MKAPSRPTGVRARAEPVFPTMNCCAGSARCPATATGAPPVRAPPGAPREAGPLVRPAVPRQPRADRGPDAGRVRRPAQGDQQLRPGGGTSLSAYAAPCVTGEIKRHFRDKRWQVHVRRAAQELLLELRKATEELTHQLGRDPATPNCRAARGHRARPARGPPGGRGVHLLFAGRPAVGPGGHHELADVLGAEDADVQHTFDMEAVATHWSELPTASSASCSALLRQPDPGRDRRAPRHLPDARVPAAGPGARPPAPPPVDAPA